VFRDSGWTTIRPLLFFGREIFAADEILRDEILRDEILPVTQRPL
jgi:hypothetical protein